MPREYIGPKVDFRVPTELDTAVRWKARRLGRPVDEVYRNTLLTGARALMEEHEAARSGVGMAPRGRA